ncbi:MAG: mobile mystery protein B [Pseudomonadota bacterium]
MTNDVTVHDHSGLLLGGSPTPTDIEINQAELLGISAAAKWMRRTRMDVCSVAFWRRLHEEMFKEVWSWAGQWRKEKKNIGVPPHQIQPCFRQLQEDLSYWLSPECDIGEIELLARTHHRAVWIHPFNNGNGRWSRLVADAVALRRLKKSALVWTNTNEDLRDPDSIERQNYISAIKAADNHDYESLIQYLADLNPEF